MNCCGPDDLADLAAKAAALSHPARLMILRHLAGEGACCCKDVVGKLDLAQSTVSQHLKVLVDAGLVQFTPERQRSRYSVDRENLDAIATGLSGWLNQCAALSAPKHTHSIQSEEA
jgi:ArsR family transcriptional regulator